MTERKEFTVFDLSSTFGLFEFEQLASNILNFTEGDLTKSFTIEEVTDTPHIFALFASCGWLEPEWFPKTKFKVSKNFIDRLKSKDKLK